MKLMWAWEHGAGYFFPTLPSIGAVVQLSALMDAKSIRGEKAKMEDV